MVPLQDYSRVTEALESADQILAVTLDENLKLKKQVDHLRSELARVEARCRRISLELEIERVEHRAANMELIRMRLEDDRFGRRESTTKHRRFLRVSSLGQTVTEAERPTPPPDPHGVADESVILGYHFLTSAGSELEEAPSADDDTCDPVVEETTAAMSRRRRPSWQSVTRVLSRG